MGPVKRVRSVSGNKASQDSQQIDFESRPFDYRRAVADSHNNNTKVIDQLKALGLLLPLDELVDL
jgi:hypothetical protein